MELDITFFTGSMIKEKKEPKRIEPEIVASIPSLDVLERDAYAVKFFSSILNDHIVIFKEKKNYARTAREFPDDILYFAEEVRNLIKFAAGPKELRIIHATKRIFRNSWLINVNCEV